jgi:CPA1 family monovalent cation:H+ antiporter
MIALLLVAALVAIAARRLRLPYTVGLVAAGVVLAAFHVAPGVVLTRELIFQFLLPPLLFEAALSIRAGELKRDFWPVLVLSTLGVVIATAVVAAGLHAAGRWPTRAALVFGALIAATDPVAVIALCKDVGIGGRLRLLIESESLLNDGVAAVLFAFLLAWTGGAPTGPFAPALSLCFIAGGGIAIGLAVGLAATLLTGRATDYLVETALTAVAAFGSFLLAERVHASGVLATVCAGLLMGNTGVLRGEGGVLTERGREVVIAFWDFAAFVANSLVFLLIGFTLAGVRFSVLGLGGLALTIGFSLLGRLLSVYPLSALFARSRRRIPLGEQHVLFWGGLRGALALALALSLPMDIPARNEIIGAAFGVVAFSVVVQGITMPALLRKLGFGASGYTAE